MDFNWKDVRKPGWAAPYLYQYMEGRIPNANVFTTAMNGMYYSQYNGNPLFQRVKPLLAVLEEATYHLMRHLIQSEDCVIHVGGGSSPLGLTIDNPCIIADHPKVFNIMHDFKDMRRWANPNHHLVYLQSEHEVLPVGEAGWPSDAPVIVIVQGFAPFLTRYELTELLQFILAATSDYKKVRIVIPDLLTKPRVNWGEQKFGDLFAGAMEYYTRSTGRSPVSNAFGNNADATDFLADTGLKVAARSLVPEGQELACAKALRLTIAPTILTALQSVYILERV